MSRATILLVGEDDETRRIIKQNLQRGDYRVSSAEDVEDALGRVGGGAGPADLILLDLVGKTTEEALRAGRRIREHAKYDGQTPLVVIAEKYGAEVEGTEANVGGNDWVLYFGEEPDQLKNLLARLTS
jgi:CheY-like chemotaxis protein